MVIQSPKIENSNHSQRGAIAMGIDTQPRQRHHRRLITFLLPLVLTVLGLVLTQTRGFSAPPGAPANAKATPATTAVLRYLTALSSGQLPGVISGQMSGHGDGLVKEFAIEIETLHQQTGKWPGILAIDYEFDQRYSREQLSAANRILIDYWKQGGLIALNWGPVNPWNDKGNWPFDFDFNASLDFDELMTPGSPVYAKWQASLARVADALTELRDAGVVVLWRPFNEMNGFWFWWGTASYPNDPEPFKRLYRQQFDYFTKERHLNNLLWVYSTNHYATCEGRGQLRCQPVAWAYPGDDVVDVIGGTAYGNDMRVADYADYLKFKKPLALAEFSPQPKTPNFNNAVYIDRLAKDYPKFAYWTTWGGPWALTQFPGAKELLNDPRVLNRGDLRWQRFQPKS